MEIMKQGVQSLRIKMQTVEVYLKEATCAVIYMYGFHPLSARLPKLALKLERLDCSHLFNLSTGASFQLHDYSLGEQ